MQKIEQQSLSQKIEALNKVVEKISNVAVEIMVDKIKSKREGIFMFEFRNILRKKVNTNSSDWERAAAQELQRITSYEELLEVFDDKDPNKRIVAADAIGHAGNFLNGEGKTQLTLKLIGLLGDPAANNYGYGCSQIEEESITFLSAIAAESLVRFGYEKDVHAVFEKARKKGFKVEERQNVL